MDFQKILKDYNDKKWYIGKKSLLLIFFLQKNRTPFPREIWDLIITRLYYQTRRESIHLEEILSLIPKPDCLVINKSIYLIDIKPNDMYLMECSMWDESWRKGKCFICIEEPAEMQRVCIIAGFYPNNYVYRNAFSHTHPSRVIPYFKVEKIEVLYKFDF